MSLELCDQIKASVHKDRVEILQGANLVNIKALDALIKDVLVPQLKDSISLSHPYSLNIFVGKDTEEASSFNQSLLIHDGQFLTDLEILINIGSSDEKPGKDDIAQNPRLKYAESAGRFNLDTLVANYLLFSGLKPQIDRVRTGFMFPMLFKCRPVCPLSECLESCQQNLSIDQIAGLYAAKFAEEHMEKILNRVREPVIVIS